MIFFINILIHFFIILKLTYSLEAGFKIYNSTNSEIIAYRTCSGLLNRIENIQTYCYYDNEYSNFWINNSLTNPINILNKSEYFELCSKKNTKGLILYNFTKHQTMLPNILTLASIYNYVPIEKYMIYLFPNKTIMINIDELWNNFTPQMSTIYMFENYINHTNNLAKINPGYDVHDHPFHPQPNPHKIYDFHFIDYAIQNKMFIIFLLNGCIPYTLDYKIYSDIFKNNPWDSPIKIYGYDDTWAILGDIFEAETICNKEHNLGQIATTSFKNAAFHSNYNKENQNKKKIQNFPNKTIIFNHSKSYFSFVYGDGDNTAIVQSDFLKRFQEKINICKQNINDCIPINWGISRHLNELSPKILKWFFDRSKETKNDYFLLPPSGDLYAYPSLMKNDDMQKFIQNTENDCKLLSCNAAISWEFFTTWNHAIHNYFPKYNHSNIMNGFFLLNVPYLFPILKLKSYILKISDNVVLFKPIIVWYEYFVKNLKPYHIVNILNNANPGTISYIFIQSNVPIQDILSVYYNLSEHIEIVDYYTLIQLSFQKLNFENLKI